MTAHSILIGSLVPKGDPWKNSQIQMPIPGATGTVEATELGGRYTWVPILAWARASRLTSASVSVASSVKQGEHPSLKAWLWIKWG